MTRSLMEEEGKQGDDYSRNGCFYIASLIPHDNSFGLWYHFTEEAEGQRDEVIHP